MTLIKVLFKPQSVTSLFRSSSSRSSSFEVVRRGRRSGDFSSNEPHATSNANNLHSPSDGHSPRGVRGPADGATGSGQGQNSTNSDDVQHRDSLPEDRQKLEGLLNYHLSQLQRLRIAVEKSNTDIEGYKVTFKGIKNTPGMKHCAERLGELINETRQARNNIGRYIGFHRLEIERIAAKNVAIKEALGLEPTVPEVVKNLPSQQEWNSLFLV